MLHVPNEAILMKSVASLFALAAFVALPVCAQSSSSDQPQFAPVPPPPGMNDPGVKAVAPPSSTPPPNETPAEPTPDQPIGKPIPLPPMPGDTAPRTAPPQVSVRQQGDNTVQEYRQNGRVYMIIVTPKNGIAQTYMVDASGHLQGVNGAPPVQPVMYKVLEWGKSKPAEASSSGD
jgi:hypothetical protein